MRQENGQWILEPHDSVMIGDQKITMNDDKSFSMDTITDSATNPVEEFVTAVQNELLLVSGNAGDAGTVGLFCAALV